MIKHVKLSVFLVFVSSDHDYLRTSRFLYLFPVMYGMTALNTSPSFVNPGRCPGQSFTNLVDVRYKYAHGIRNMCDLYHLINPQLWLFMYNYCRNVGVCRNYFPCGYSWHVLGVDQLTFNTHLASISLSWINGYEQYWRPVVSNPAYKSGTWAIR